MLAPKDGKPKSLASLLVNPTLFKLYVHPDCIIVNRIRLELAAGGELLYLFFRVRSFEEHVRGKQDLLSLLAEEICAPMREPDQTLSWRNQLEDLANEFRRVLLAHRDAARVLASSGGPSGPNRLRLTEIGLRTLLDAGFSHRDAAYAGFLLNDFVVMFVLEETQFANAGTESASEDSFSNVQNWIEALPPNEYPGVVTLADYLIAPDADERFQFGIEIMRNGLETRLARHKA